MATGEQIDAIKAWTGALSYTAQLYCDFSACSDRMEIIDEVNGITVIQDFAHHPTAVDPTLKIMRERFSGARNDRGF